MKLRLERLDYDPHKDAQKAAQLAPLWEAYWQRRQTLTSPPEEFLELRWMLEELRVSRLASRIENRLPGLRAEVAERFGEWVGIQIKPDRSGRPVRFES